METMDEDKLYRALGALTRDRDKWEQSIPYVSSLLAHESVKIQAKALWLLGEMGLYHPLRVQHAVDAIAAFCGSAMPLLRERAANALGRIGRADCSLIRPHWNRLLDLARDAEARVRLSFLWALENIATNAPEVCENVMPLFEKLLYDESDKVRMEAPEIFRVLGKRRPEYVRPYLKKLQAIAERDSNRVVRIHCLGAIRAAS